MITNRNEVFDKLVEILKRLEIEMRPFETDVYAYYDSETGMVELMEYENVGGHSYLDDQHYTMHCCPDSSCKDIFDVYTDEEDIIYIISDCDEKKAQKLTEEIKIWAEENDCDFDYHAVEIYVKRNDSLLKILEEAYADYVNADEDGVLSRRAEDILTEYEEYLETI